MTYKLTKSEQKIMDAIKRKSYMEKTIELIEEFVRQSQLTKQDAYKNVFDEIYRILYEAKDHVDIYLARRKADGEIKDEKQAMRSIAGSSFSNAIIYIFLKNKELQNIDANIFITSQTSTIPSFDKISVINVDGEMQKPDCDLVIYSLNCDNTLKKCMILSLKTSLRERAGQTYKWKLLMEIATSKNCNIKKKYNISYNPPTNPLVCFATVNFYNEINNPQHRGMFKFFDKSFIAKNIEVDFISRMSSLPEYVNNFLL
jgi:type II restriction enzyme